MRSFFFSILSCLSFITLHAGNDHYLVPSEIQVSRSQQFLQSETPSLSLMEGTPNIVVHNHVHAITGSFFDCQTDLEMGPLDFNLERSYISLDHSGGSLLHGWNHNHEDVLRVETRTNHRYVVSKGRSGGEFLYHGRYEQPSFKLDSQNFKKGVTNCGRGELSGRTNVINNQLQKNIAEKKYVLNTGSGAKLDFKKLHKQNHFYQIVSHKTPSQHNLKYSYNLENKRIEKVSFLNPINKQLAFLQFKYPGNLNLKQFSKGKTKRKPVIEVKASDGRVVKYTIDSFEKHSCGEYIDKRRYRICKVERPNAPNEWYEYSKPNCCIPEQVIKKKRPDGRFLQIEYYGQNKGFSTEKVKALRGPAGNLSEPADYFTFRYEKKSDAVASTIVKDGLGHRTIYKYSPKNFRLSELIKFNGRSPHYSIHSIEKLEWSDEALGSNLLSRVVCDYNNNIVLGRRYEYDDRGNVLKSHFEGNLTGKNSRETFTVESTYSNDGFNVPTSILEGSTRIDMFYKPQSELLTAKVTTAGPYRHREFYEYDENQAVALVINDDGSSSNVNDLTGVTERTIQRITNMKGALAGLPETTEYYYVDLINSSEMLLKKIVCRYDSLGRLVEELVYDNLSNFLFSKRWEYNAYGQKTLEVNPLGETTLFTYDSNGNLLTEQRLIDNRFVHYTYDLCNRLIKRETHLRGDSYIESFEYDVMGNKIASTDVYGNKTHYHYDSLGQLSSVTYPKTYDDNNNEYSRTEFKEYDILGNITLEVDGLGNRTSKKYTARGAPYLIEYPNGATEHYEYSIQGQLVKYTSPNGTIIRTEYDELSRPISESTYDAAGSLLLTKTKRYSAFHLIREDNGDGLITHYSYDGAGRVVEVVKGKQRQVYQYDALGRKTEVHNFVNGDIIINKTDYDFLDRITSESTLNGTGDLQLYQAYEYDADDNRILVKTVNQAGESVTRTEYNALGQLVKSIDPLNHTTYHYYQPIKTAGRQSCEHIVVDPQGNQTIYFHNELGQVTSEHYLNAMGQKIKETTFGYDHVGNRTLRMDRVIAPNRVEKQVMTLWTYDCMNRLLSTTEAYGSPQQRTVLREYDTSGNIFSLTKADGIFFSYIYDALGRLEGYLSSDNSVNYRFEYNLSNNPIKIADLVNSSTTMRSYDANQHLISEVLANGLTLTYENDALGRVTQIGYPDRSLVRYSYNGSFLEKVERFNANGEFAYAHAYSQYDYSGNVTRSELICNLGNVYSDYDLMNRTQRIKTPAWEEHHHTYDTLGNLIYREWDDKILTYSYDDLNQLNSESGFVTNSFVNDSMFNQISVNDTTRTFNDAHELQDIYRYDRNGNVIQKNGFNFEYDALNRLTKVTDNTNGKTFEYQYDSYHRCIAKVSDATERYFYYGNLDLGATDKSGVITQLRVLGKRNHAEIGAAIAVEIEGTIYAPLHDSQGNVVTLIDARTGLIAESCRYSAYGQEIAEYAFGDRLTPWRCASKRMDDETGFINFGRRFYDPSELRWISLDPVLISEGTNRYNYLENNPFKYVDPDGRLTFIIPIALYVWGGTTAAVATITATQIAVAGGVLAGGAAIYVAEKNGISTRSTDLVFVGGSLYTGVNSNTHLDRLSYPTIANRTGAQTTDLTGNQPNDVLDPSTQKDPEEPKKKGDPGPVPILKKNERRTSGNLQRQVEKGQSPKSIDRVDKGRGSFEKDHVHFKDGAALNHDGTWKHNPRDLLKEEIQWLKSNNWSPPGGHL